MSDSGVDALRRFRNEGGFFRLDARACFRLSGQDRVRYLNGQVSNDVRKLIPGVAMQACVLSAKGKLDAVIWMWCEADAIVVECAWEAAEHLGMRLEKYIVADDVTVESLEAADEIHVFGPAADALPDAQVLRRLARLGVPGADISATAAQDLPVECAEESKELLRIENAIPKWGAELSADTLPAEAGLDAAAVDFHKGCYIGQEVASRIRSVGHANRSLQRFLASGNTVLEPGTELFPPGEFDGRPAGVVTSSAYHFGLSRGVGLCYIRRGVGPEAVLETAPSPGAATIKICPFLPCELS